ncbi:MAG: hypothetical protein ACO1SV_22680 [Fimbriimonas sp.]
MDTVLNLYAMSTRDGLYWPFGLDIFDPSLVTTCFGVGALLQAVLVGRPLGLSWGRALGISFVVNVGWFVFLMSFCLAMRFGGSATPNPTRFAVEQLTHLALVNTVVLSSLWRLVVRDTAPFGRVLLRMALAQAVLVPVSLLLLMSPREPYRHLEQVVSMRRRWRLLGAAKEMVGPLPRFSSAEEFAAALGLPEEVVRAPRYPRWATRDEGIVAVQVNRALSGWKPSGAPRKEWLFRYQYRRPDGEVGEGERYVDLSTGRVTPPD